MCSLIEEEFTKYSKVLIAALHAGADFDGVQASLCCEWGTYLGEMPLRVALFLRLEISQWQQLEFFLPSQEKWRPKATDVDLAHYFFCPGLPKLCINKIQSAERAALDITSVTSKVWAGGVGGNTSLLGIAILLGQPDGAIACVRQGIEVTVTASAQPWHNFSIKKYLDGEMPEGEVVQIRGGPQVQVAAPSDCRSAACAAGSAAVRRDAGEKGVAVYQVMRKMFRGRPFPVALVHSILAFSVRVPYFVDQLGLSDLVEGWLMPVPPSVPKFRMPSIAIEEWQGRKESKESQDIRDTMQEAGALVFAKGIAKEILFFDVVYFCYLPSGGLY